MMLVPSFLLTSICQEDGEKELLQDPQNNRGFQPKSIHELSSRMLRFNQQYMPECAIDGLIRKLLPDFDPGPKKKPDKPEPILYAEKLASTLITNRAKFHKSCKLAFAETKFPWAEKAAKRKREEEKAQASAEAARNVSPIKKTRSNVDAATPYQREVQTRMCFYHNAFGEDDNTCTGVCDPALPANRVVESTEITTTVLEKAKLLNNSVLIAKCAGVDMFSADAVYHRKCHTRLFNLWKAELKRKERAKGHPQDQFDDSSPWHTMQSDSAESIALAEIVFDIEDVASRSFDDKIVPVFELRDLFTRYVKRIEELTPIKSTSRPGTRFRDNENVEPDQIDEDDVEGTASKEEPQDQNDEDYCLVSPRRTKSSQANRTKFKDRLLRVMPDLTDEKDRSGRVVFLYKKDVGPAVREACARAISDDDMVCLSRAAGICRRAGLFDPEPQFNGTFDKKSITDSVSCNSLTLFMDMLIRSPNAKVPLRQDPRAPAIHSLVQLA